MRWTDLGTPEGQIHVAASTIADLRCEEVGVRVILQRSSASEDIR